MQQQDAQQQFSLQQQQQPQLQPIQTSVVPQSRPVVLHQPQPQPQQNTQFQTQGVQLTVPLLHKNTDESQKFSDSAQQINEIAQILNSFSAKPVHHVQPKPQQPSLPQFQQPQLQLLPQQQHQQQPQQQCPVAPVHTEAPMKSFVVHLTPPSTVSVPMQTTTQQTQQSFPPPYAKYTHPVKAKSVVQDQQIIYTCVPTVLISPEKKLQQQQEQQQQQQQQQQQRKQRKQAAPSHNNYYNNNINSSSSSESSDYIEIEKTDFGDYAGNANPAANVVIEEPVEISTNEASNAKKEKKKSSYVYYDDEDGFTTFGSEDEMSYEDDDKDDDYEEKPSKSKNNKNGNNKKKKRKRKNTDDDYEDEGEEDIDYEDDEDDDEEEEEEEEDEEDGGGGGDDDDSDSDYGSTKKKKGKKAKRALVNKKKKRQTKRGRQKRGAKSNGNGNENDDYEDEFGVPVRASLRNKERKSYREYGEDEDLDEEEKKELREARRAAETFDGDCLEHILRHRMRIKKPTVKNEGEETDAVKEEEEEEDGEHKDNEESVDEALRPAMPKDPEEVNWEEDVEYLVKWKGWAVIHNSWGSYNYLSQFNGFKKVLSYIKIAKQRMLIKMNATAEEVEQMDIQQELMLAEYDEAKNVERIVAMRKVKPTKDNPHNVMYYVKWCAMPYSECTWENPDDIKGFQAEIDDFLQRNERYIYAPRVPKPFVFVKLEKQPEWLEGGVLRDYQVEGLNWMTYCYCNGTNGILADEMGLGKTVQTISFLERLVEDYSVFGPFLVVVPLSTLPNWAKEFKKWAPRMNVVVYCGNTESRRVIQQHEFHGQSNKLKFNVLLTTYEIVMKDKSVLGALHWKHLVVDEAHRLKNAESLLYRVLMEFRSSARMLITGTPLQNSLRELWALLHFLMPEKFPGCEAFEAEYADLQRHECIKRLHGELRPYILRRLKRDVEKSLPQKREQILRVAATPLQRKYYRWVIARNFRELNRGVKGEGKTTLLNVVGELKKVCNHPYLFPSAEQVALALLPQDAVLEGLVCSSGKMQLLDKLLERLKETGHRVLIFSQMVRMLDILSDYLRLKAWPFQRLDGSTSREMRQKAMDHFNAEGSTDFVFLLSTRAGGLGINLATADTVVIFDSDWNPQNDLQAEARCHRIGQDKTVNIYRLLISKSVEENILRSAKRKMVLDQLVIQSMDTTAAGILNKAATTTEKALTPITSNDTTAEDNPNNSNNNNNNDDGNGGSVAATAGWIGTGTAASGSEYTKEELDAIIKFGAEDIFKDDDNESQQQQQQNSGEIDIDKILERAEVVNSSGSTETPAEELLNTFKVTSFGDAAASAEDDFWSKLITPEVQAEADEINKLGDRRRAEEKAAAEAAKAKAKAERSDHALTAAAAAAATAANGGGDDGSNTARKKKVKRGAIEDKEVKALYRGLRMYGSPDRMDEIVDTSKSLLGARKKETLVSAAKDIINAAEAFVKEEKEKEEEEEEGSGSGDEVKRGKTLIHKGVEFDPVEFLGRIATIEFLGAVVGEYEGNPLAFRVTSPLKPPAWGKVAWSSKDDSMLLLGVHRHGYGNWSKIIADPDLGLGKLADTSVGNSHLSRRVEALIKALRADAASSSPKKVAKEKGGGSNNSSKNRSRSRTSKRKAPAKKKQRSSTKTKTKNREEEEDDDDDNNNDYDDYDDDEKEEDDDENSNEDDNQSDDDDDDDYASRSKSRRRQSSSSGKKSTPPPTKKAKRGDPKKEDSSNSNTNNNNNNNSSSSSHQKGEKVSYKNGDKESRRKMIACFVPEEWDLFWRKNIPPADSELAARAQKTYASHKAECDKALKPVVVEMNKIRYFRVNVEANIEFAISKTVKYLRIIGAHIDKLDRDENFVEALWHSVAINTYRDPLFVKTLYEKLKSGALTPPTHMLKAITVEIKEKLPPPS